MKRERNDATSRTRCFMKVVPPHDFDNITEEGLFVPHPKIEERRLKLQFWAVFGKSCCVGGFVVGGKARDGIHESEGTRPQRIKIVVACLVCPVERLIEGFELFHDAPRDPWTCGVDGLVETLVLWELKYIKEW